MQNAEANARDSRTGIHMKSIISLIHALHWLLAARHCERRAGRRHYFSISLSPSRGSTSTTTRHYTMCMCVCVCCSLSLLCCACSYCQYISIDSFFRFFLAFTTIAVAHRFDKSYIYARFLLSRKVAFYFY